jgi:diguanylate cyclase (GGDEF)-like protein
MNSQIQTKIKELLSEAKHISSTYPGRAYELSKEAYDLAKQYHLTEEEGNALIGMSLTFRTRSEINSMLECAYHALEIFEELQIPEGQIRALNLISIAYFYDSEYEQSHSYLIEARTLLEAHPDQYMLSCVFNNLGEALRESMRYEEALEYYNQGLSISREINADMNTASLLGNIGEVYYLQNMTEEALRYLNQSYQMILKVEDNIILAETENKLGKVYISKNNSSLAEEYFYTALRRLERVDNKYYSIDVLLNIAQLESTVTQNVSLYYFDLAIHYAVDTNAKKKLCVAYELMAEYYEKIKDYQNALDCYKRYHNFDKEISVSMIGNKFAAFKIELEHLNEKQDFDNSEMINTRLEKEIAQQKNELDKIHRLNEVLEKKAYEDELTEIPNRRYINMELMRIWDQTEYQDMAIALFILDIDNFKKYNDNWGHVAGDLCLQRVAKCLNKIHSLRNDIFGRYGGEEFIYIALNASFYEAIELGELFRTQVEEMSNSLSENEMKSNITISVGGVWGKLSDFNNANEVIQHADRQLYKAKDLGRNKTVVSKDIR